MIPQKTIDFADLLLKEYKQKTILAEKKKLESLWVEKYNFIKDKTWPDCYNYSDFYNLNSVIQTELIEIHKFSPEIWFKSITSTTESQYDIRRKRTEHKILIDNLNIIKDKVIIDFACHIGPYSFYCYEQGCKFIQGIEVRPEAVAVAKSIQTELGISNYKIKFDVGDIHDYDTVKKLCSDKDTVLLCGIMYHVHDHVEILQSVCQPSVQSVVIETREHPSIMDLDQPLVWWEQEHTATWLSGFYKNQNIIPVGWPNLSWFKLIMSTMNFDLVASDTQIINTHPSAEEEFNQHRSIQIYQRIVANT